MGTDESDGLKRFAELFLSVKRAPEGGVRRSPGPLLAVTSLFSPCGGSGKTTAVSPERGADRPLPPGLVPIMPGHPARPFPLPFLRIQEGPRDVPCNSLKSDRRKLTPTTHGKSRSRTRRDLGCSRFYDREFGAISLRFESTYRSRSCALGFAAGRGPPEPSCSRGPGTAGPAPARPPNVPPVLILFPDGSVENIVSPDASVGNLAGRHRRRPRRGNEGPVTRVTWRGRRKSAYGGHPASRNAAGSQSAIISARH